MNFTYKAYEGLIASLKEHGYDTVSYEDAAKASAGPEKCVILRHDVDYSIDRAVRIAEIEHSAGVSSTFFFLLTSGLYNICSGHCVDIVKHIASLGHYIGLHFDETVYPTLSGDTAGIVDAISHEARILEDITGEHIGSVSMHRPGRQILDADLQIPGIINSYGKTFFEQFKYLSDSRRRWREPVDEIIAGEECAKLHILTHPFWYNDTESDIHDTVMQFVNAGNWDRYDILADNITDISAIMSKEEIVK